MLKLFHSGHAGESLDWLREYGLLQYLFPDAVRELDDPANAEFVKLAMQSTDDRVRLDKPVTPAFLFAALLWAPVSQQTQANGEAGMPHAVALQKAATQVIASQVRHVSIPRRFTTVMREIWSLQSRFRFHSGKRASAVLHHPRFRAAYDFLCLRANAGETGTADCRWWTEFQERSPEEQKEIIAVQKPAPKKRRRRPRKNRGGER